MNAKQDFSHMTTRAIVEAHNQLAETPVKRFRDRTVAEERLRVLLDHHGAVIGEDGKVHKESDVAKTNDKPAQTGGEAPKEPTIKELTEQYNQLVPEAQKLGVKCKHHTSMFGSKEGAHKQLSLLKQRMDEARKATQA